MLHDITFTVQAGTVTGLVGPSGSGKTTLIRAIVGTQRQVTGRVQVLGHDAGDGRLRDRVGYLTQVPAVYADISVQANLSYFATILDAPHGDVDRVLDMVGLTAERQRRVDTLSGGQRARVGLAATLLGRPELLVLDEPTVGLDPLLRAELWDTFRDLADHGVTMLVSSHVMDEAARCSRVLLLRDGRLLADDAPQQLLARTRTADLDAAFLALVRAS